MKLQVVQEENETKYIFTQEYDLDSNILEEDIFYNITKSICPKCKKSIDAQIVAWFPEYVYRGWNFPMVIPLLTCKGMIFKKK